MPAPTNERQALERERAELPGQIAAYQRELDTTPAENNARRERLEWQTRRDQKRLAEIEAGPTKTRDLWRVFRATTALAGPEDEFEGGPSPSGDGQMWRLSPNP